MAKQWVEEVEAVRVADIYGCQSTWNMSDFSLKEFGDSLAWTTRQRQRRIVQLLSNQKRSG
jgi:hypothetical protein